LTSSAQEYINTLPGRTSGELGVALAELAELCEKGSMEVPDGAFPLGLLRDLGETTGKALVPKSCTDLRQFVRHAEEIGAATIVCAAALPGSIIIFADDKLGDMITGSIITKLNGVWYDSAEMDSGRVAIHRRAWSCYGPLGVARRANGNYARWTKCIIPVNRLVK